MQSIITTRHSPPLFLAAASLLLALGGTVAGMELRFERSAIAAGELWRLLTGHLIHLGWTHLLLNLAGLLMVWLLVGTAYSVRHWWWQIVFIALGISGGLYLLRPELNWYAGLSGLLYGMLASGLVGRCVNAPLESSAIAIVLTVKLAWEQEYGSISASLLTGPVVLDAHLFGALSGLLAACIVLVLRKNQTA